MNKTIILSALASAATLFAGREAHAQVCMNNQCGANQTTITYTGTSDGVDVSATGNGATAIYGDATGTTSTGVSGAGTSYGVYGTSSAGYGGYFSSSTGTALYGTTAAGTGEGGVEGLNTGGGGSGVYGQSDGGGYGVQGKLLGSTGGYAIYGNDMATGGTHYAGYFNGSVNVVTGSSYLYNATTCVGGFCLSDQRLKRNIEPLTGAMDQLLRLRGVTFEWKNPEDHGNQATTQTGFIAQEVEKVFPGWVEENGTTRMKGVVLPPMQIAALTIESLRELNARVTAAEAKNKALEDRILALEANRRPMVSALTAEGTLFGLGLVAMAGAFVVSRRKRNE